MSRYRNALVILNPVSGRGHRERRREAIEKVLHDSGIAFEVRETSGDGEARSWAASAERDAFDLVVAVGGDGTIREAVEGLIDASAAIPLAIAPAGTANILAQALGLPLRLEKALAAGIDGQTVKIDAGRLSGDGRRFLLALAVGFPASLIEDTPRELKRRFGWLAYAAAAIRNLRRLPEAQIEFETGSRRRQLQGHTVLVLNLATPGQWEHLFAHPLRPDDGHLDLLVPVTPSIWRFLRLAVPVVLRLRKSFRAVHHHRTRRLWIRTDPPLPVQIDGEPVGQTPVEVEVIPQAVSILIPSDAPLLQEIGPTATRSSGVTSSGGTSIPGPQKPKLTQDPANRSNPLERIGPQEPVTLPVEDHLDLHAFSPKEIPDVLDAYLEAAVEIGLREVRVIHGKGTGFQRERVRQVLALHPHVISYEDAPAHRGHWGATLVRLRR